jgi:hypothetical protein
MKEGANWVLGLAIMAAIFLLIALLLHGMVWASNKALPWLLVAGSRTFDICFFIFLPLCVFKKTRPWAGLGFYFASYVFGVTLWALSCVFAFGYWGYFGLVVGLLLAGVGVFPVALLAVLVHGDWPNVGWLLIGLALVIGTRFVGAVLTNGKPSEEVA